MSRQGFPRRLLIAALGSGALTLCAPPVRAGDAVYCITCKNPDQTYRCRITGVVSRPADALKLYCVIRTAKEGHHTSCSAQGGGASCDGLVKVYDYEGPALPEGLAADPRIKELTDKVGHDRRAFAQPKSAAPKTLFELGGRAVKASRKGITNARSALGGSTPAADPVSQPVAVPAPPNASPAKEAAAGYAAEPATIESPPVEPLPAEPPTSLRARARRNAPSTPPRMRAPRSAALRRKAIVASAAFSAIAAAGLRGNKRRAEGHRA